MKFKVGDKVIIKPGTRFYNMRSTNNPSDTVGEIIIYNSAKYFQYDVLWPNLSRNDYNPEDLELAIPYLNEQKLKQALGLQDEKE